MKAPLLRLLGAFLPLLALALVAGGCADPPTQHNEARYGVVRVFVAPEWLELDKVQIRQQLVNLDALGPSFVEAGEGGRSTARVIVQPMTSGAGCFADAAHWIVGTRIVEIDRTCMVSESSFRQAVGHEVGHALGMLHICEREGDLPDCSPVGYGDAMMGPRLRPTDDAPGFTEAYTGALGFDEPTDLDLAEFRRVYAVVEVLPPPSAARDGGVR